MAPHGDGSIDMEKPQSETTRSISTVVFVIGTLLFLHLSIDWLIYGVSESISISISSSFSYLLFSDGAAAMQAEALPLVNKFGLSLTTDSQLRALLFYDFCWSCWIYHLKSWVLYHGVHNDLRINVVCPGRDAALGHFCFSHSQRYHNYDLTRFFFHEPRSDFFYYGSFGFQVGA